jgi:hypothetical protein
MRPDWAVATGSAPRGARSWSVKTARSAAAKSLWALAVRCCGGNDVSHTSGDRNPSEAAKHCLHDGRIAPRGVNHSRRGFWDESR